jgi:outer membrane lipoprotein carrier protein
VAGSASARTPAAASLPADLRALIDAIQARYDGLRDFKADFTQESRVQAAPSAQKAGGQIYFQKPGRMRWNYRTPEPQEIVINGGKLWQYVPDDRQVVIQGFDAARVEYTFLTGVGDLERDFKLRWANPRKRPGDPLVYVRLVPRNEDATFSEVVIGVDPRDHRILATEVNDLFGNTTIIRFQNYKNNVGLARSLFAFTTPKGVDVIDNTAAAGTRTR